MSKTRLVITAVTVEGRSQGEVARAYGVSQGWIGRLVARYRAEGEAAFWPRSRRPHASPTALPLATVGLIVRLRKELAEDGLDAGPHTICWHLRHHHGVHLSAATVARYLTAAGLVVAAPRKRPRSSYLRFQAEVPNECWQADFTQCRTWAGFVYVAFIVDVFAQKIVAWHAATGKDTSLVMTPLRMALWQRDRDGQPTVPGELICHSDAGSQGGFKWSSQHLGCGGVGWDDRGVGRQRRREGRRCGRPERPGVNQREVKQAFWRRIGEGLSSEDAASACGVSQPVGTRWFRDAGGMPPISLVPCSGRYLSFAEREEIALLTAQRYRVRELARRLGRSPSTISRELRRNAATRGGQLEYRATVGQWKAERAARRPETAKLAENDKLRQYVQDRLAGTIERPDGTEVPGPDVRWGGRRHGRRQDRRWATAWSPEQIANRLPIDFPDDESMRISHEAIYQALYVQGRGALRRELTACLRTGRVLRVPRARTRGRGKKFVTSEVLISERPAEAEDRAVPGHWEGDLIIGLNSSAIGTLVERTTRFTMLLHLPPWRGTADLGPRTGQHWPATAPWPSEMPSLPSSRHCPSYSDGR